MAPGQEQSWLLYLLENFAEVRKQQQKVTSPKIKAKMRQTGKDPKNDGR